MLQPIDYNIEHSSKSSILFVLRDTLLNKRISSFHAENVMTFPIYRAALAIAMLAAPLAFCDGLQDNKPDQVRRIPRLGIDVPAEQREQLEAGLKELGAKINEIQASEHPELERRVPDIEVLHRAVHDALKYQEFFKEKEIDDALSLLELGMDRAKGLSRELQTFERLKSRDLTKREHAPLLPWLKTTRSGLIVRGYRSKIDHTVQPYGLVFPEGYQPDAAKKYRLDVWFHGRGETMSENGFLSQRRKNRGVFSPKDTIVLHPYGRYSNAFKFAGEVDVLEAIDHVRANYDIDDDRISVRGFSMGGAACWQFAVHYADRWFAANPGAGFSETPEFLKFFQKETLEPTWYEEKLWRMYDCNLWAKNLLHCPTVAYSGEDDIQKQAADIMEAAMDDLDVQLVHVIGPKTGHKYHPDAAADVAARFDRLAEHGRDKFPHQIDLVTYTLKYNRMHWLTVDALEEHWEQAKVSARIGDEPRIDLVVKNVSQLTIDIPSGAWPYRITEPVKVFINGEGADVVRPMSDRSLKLQLTNQDDEWVTGSANPADKTPLRKRHNLQGPIDDALMDSFIFVRPTGSSANEAVSQWSNAELERAIEHWRRHFRGNARVKDDTDISEADIKSANLILWGDPSSNQLIEKVLAADSMPFSWNADSIRLGDKEFEASNHGLIAIYPNPMNPDRYVVFNSSFTFREFAYLNNARQVAKLPDWAVVDVRTPPDSLWPGKIVDANFFDENWQLKGGR